jgi:DNA gyrase subunit A
VIALQTTDRNGEMVAALQVNSEHELMLISSTGTLVRTPVSEISIVGRNTQGVRLIRLGEGERLTGIERIESLGEDAPGADPSPESLGGTPQESNNDSVPDGPLDPPAS